MEMLGGGGGVAAQCRKPDIMADAAYVILTRDSKSFTGNFVIGLYYLVISYQVLWGPTTLIKGTYCC